VEQNSVTVIISSVRPSDASDASTVALGLSFATAMSKSGEHSVSRAVLTLTAAVDSCVQTNERTDEQTKKQETHKTRVEGDGGEKRGKSLIAIKREITKKKEKRKEQKRKNPKDRKMGYQNEKQTEGGGEKKKEKKKERKKEENEAAKRDVPAIASDLNNVARFRAVRTRPSSCPPPSVVSSCSPAVFC